MAHMGRFLTVSNDLFVWVVTRLSFPDDPDELADRLEILSVLPFSWRRRIAFVLWFSMGVTALGPLAFTTLSLSLLYLFLVALLEYSIRFVTDLKQSEAFWGDLHERRDKLTKRIGTFRAECWMWHQVVTSLLPLAWAAVRKWTTPRPIV